ncbi:MAG: hypothetical protein ACE5GS_04355 [Kiloniellaceae bacterium]
MSQSSPPPSAIRRVPVGATVMEAYGTVLGRLGFVFKAAALPFLLSIALAALSVLAQRDWFLSFPLMVVGFVPYTLFGVAWHRLTLLGPGLGAPAVFPGWTRRHWRFLGYVLAVMLIVYAVLTAFGLFGSALAGGRGGHPLPPVQALVLFAALVAVLVGLPYLMMRLSFVFPAVAVDEAYGLAHSWAHTRGQGFRLLAVIFVTALPMVALIWAVGWILGVYVLPDPGIIAGQEGVPTERALLDFFAQNAVSILFAQFVLAALSYVLMALVVSAISLAFRIATGWVPAPAAPAGGAGPGGG